MSENKEENQKRSAEQAAETTLDAKKQKLDVESEEPTEVKEVEPEVKETNGKSTTEVASDKKLKGKTSKKYEDVPDEEEDEDNDDEDEDDDDVNSNDDFDDDDLEEDSLEEIDTSNIIHSGRRTRGVVIDYKKAAEKIGKDVEDDEDEEVDADFKA